MSAYTKATVQFPLPTLLLQMKSSSQTTFLIKKSQMQFLFCLPLSGRFCFLAGLQNYSNKLNKFSHTTKGHLTIVILQSLPPTSTACSLSPHATSIWLCVVCGVLLPWSVSPCDQ